MTKPPHGASPASETTQALEAPETDWRARATELQGDLERITLMGELMHEQPAGRVALDLADGRVQQLRDIRFVRPDPAFVGEESDWPFVPTDAGSAAYQEWKTLKTFRFFDLLARAEAAELRATGAEAEVEKLRNGSSNASRAATEVEPLQPASEPAAVWDRNRACAAAREASMSFGQWVPQMWLDLFFKHYEAAK